MKSTDLVERGRMAHRRRSWSEAHEALSAADRATGLSAGDLWLLALAAYLTGREREFLDTLERVHHAHLDAGEPVAAARAAFWIGFRLASRGEIGPATGWLGRATRLLDRENADCVERGYLLLADALRHVMTGDPAAARHAAERAAREGERFRDADLLALAIHVQGRVLLEEGRIDDGLALLDEAMVAVATDELSPHVTGLVYCSVIGACRRVYALGRAHEWTAALAAWCDRQPDLRVYTGECMVYRAEILQMHGSWEAAIDEARRACERLTGGAEPQATAAAFYQEGEVLRLRGDFDAAEEAYRNASRLGREPQPGLALLRLAQGRRGAAAAAIRRALAETSDPLRRARLLPAHIEIALATDAVDEARESCTELERIATSYGGGVLDTIAEHARGAVHLAAGDPTAALVSLRRAWNGWRALDAPYEAARARVLLARACGAVGDEDTAALELDAARTAFEKLGAAPDVASLRMHGGAARDPSHGLTRRELDVLALVATGRTNRAIATELFISEKTVARHISNIFAKLDISSRAAATAFAYENGLLSPPA